MNFTPCSNVARQRILRLTIISEIVHVTSAVNKYVTQSEKPINLSFSAFCKRLEVDLTQVLDSA